MCRHTKTLNRPRNDTDGRVRDYGQSRVSASGTRTRRSHLGPQWHYAKGVNPTGWSWACFIATGSTTAGSMPVEKNMSVRPIHVFIPTAAGDGPVEITGFGLT